jgi:hypothetical protein
LERVRAEPADPRELLRCCFGVRAADRLPAFAELLFERRRAVAELERLDDELAAVFLAPVCFARVLVARLDDVLGREDVAASAPVPGRERPLELDR